MYIFSVFIPQLYKFVNTYQIPVHTTPISSLLSPQSLRPLHFQLSGIHFVLSHKNWFFAQKQQPLNSTLRSSVIIIIVDKVSYIYLNYFYMQRKTNIETLYISDYCASLFPKFETFSWFSVKEYLQFPLQCDTTFTYKPK